MTSQAHPQPTAMASYFMAFGPAHPASVQADTARGMVRTHARSLPSISTVTTNSVIAGAVSPVNLPRASLTRNASSISNAMYSATGNTAINTLIEVERRGAEREAQVQTVTKSMRDITTDCTQARTTRTAYPASAIRPTSTMTRTTNSTIRRASGETRSLH